MLRVYVQILPKHVKIGAFWRDIVYENILMLCYQCGRIGHRELHYSERIAELTTTPPHEPEPRGNQGPLAPTHEHTPWKTMQTRRARAQGPTPETSTRGKMYQRESQPPVNPRVQTVSPVHVMRTPQVGSVIGQGHDRLRRPTGLHREEVASHGKKLNLLQPREVDLDCMQVTCMATYPSTKQLTPYLQDMQHLEDKNDDLHPAPTQTTLLLNNDSLIGPKLFDTHSDRPRHASHTHSSKHPDSTCHSHHEHPFNYPPRPSSRDGEPQANMERRLFRTFQR